MLCADARYVVDSDQDGGGFISMLWNFLLDNEHSVLFSSLHLDAKSVISALCLESLEETR